MRWLPARGGRWPARLDRGTRRELGIPCVCSAETPVFPNVTGEVCTVRPEAGDGESMRLNCDSGFGSATFVTGTFGFAAAAHAVQLATRACGGAERQRA